MKKLLTILLLLPMLASTQMTMVKPVVAEYHMWYVYSDGNIWGYSNAQGQPYIKKWKMPVGVTSWTFVQGGFNIVNAIDQTGKLWQSKTFDNTDSLWGVEADTTGSAFTGNWFIEAFSLAQITIRADSSLWYGGKDVYNMYYTGGSTVTSTGTNMSYTQFSPGGIKFKKVVLGGSVILGLTNDGKVYKWSPGSRTPAAIFTPSPGAIDIFVSNVDAWGYLAPAATGSQTMGYPYVAGFYSSLWGGGPQYSTPTSIKTLWGLTQPIKEISMDWNTVHYIDSSGRLWGTGWNSFGEVGNGQEFIGHWDYAGFPGYGWTVNNNENSTGAPVQIGSKTDWRHIYSTPWFGFFKYAMDSRDSVYAWGRNKSRVLGNGITMNINTNPKPGDGTNVDQYNPNTIDLLTPTIVTPISALTVLYNFTPPTLSAGSDKTVTTTSTTLSASGHTALVYAVSQPAANGIDTIGYHYNAWTWSKVSGPSCTITSPNAQGTTVTGMSNGTYVFQVLAADDHSGLHKATITVTVNLVATNQRIQYRFHKNISRKI